MPSSVIFQTGTNFGEGAAILSPLIQEVIDTSPFNVGLEDELAKLGITMGDALTPKGEITSIVTGGFLQKIDEDAPAPLMQQIQGWTSLYQMETYATKHKVTKLFLEWLKAGARMEGNDSSVTTEILRFKDAVQQMVADSKYTVNAIATKLFTDGFSVTAPFGAGSPAGDGKALFASDHIVKKTGATFSNVIPAWSFLTATTLEAAIQQYKTTIYSQNGRRIRTPDIFTLLVPRALETTARKILNSGGDQAGVYAGTGSNANLLNVFSFQGSKVRLVILDMIGEDYFGATIGGTNGEKMWFLLNDEYARQTGAFRMFRLWDNEITVWKDDETDSMYTKLTTHFGMQHITGFECVLGFAWI